MVSSPEDEDCCIKGTRLVMIECSMFVAGWSFMLEVSISKALDGYWFASWTAIGGT